MNDYIIGGLVARPEPKRPEPPAECFDGFCWDCCNWRDMLPRAWFLGPRGFEGATCATCRGSNIQPSKRSYLWHRERLRQARS
jgi:hypothetical protein